MNSDKPLQLQLDAERYSRGYGYSNSFPVQRYVTASPKYVAKPSGLEGVVDDPLALMSANRLELARLKISMLSSQIEDRQYVNSQCLSGIEQDELTCFNEIHKLAGDYDSIRRIRLEQLLRLQSEKRGELNSFFRDTVRIQKDLIDAVLDYQGILKRGEVLDQL
jgi:hypothetical protein